MIDQKTLHFVRRELREGSICQCKECGTYLPEDYDECPECSSYLGKSSQVTEGASIATHENYEAAYRAKAERLQRQAGFCLRRADLHKEAAKIIDPLDDAIEKNGERPASAPQAPTGQQSERSVTGLLEAIRICETIRDRLWDDDAKHQQAAGADACMVALRRALAASQAEQGGTP